LSLGLPCYSTNLQGSTCLPQLIHGRCTTEESTPTGWTQKSTMSDKAIQLKMSN
jgi:hypothetical protein